MDSNALEPAAVETASQRRRRKLTALCEKHGLTVVAERSKLSAAALDQIIRGYMGEPRKDGTKKPRALGDDAAESIEDAFDLGRGWFDNDRMEDPLKMSDGALAIAFIYEKLTPAGKAHLTSTARLLDREDRGGMSGLGDVDDLKKHK